MKFSNHIYTHMPDITNTKQSITHHVNIMVWYSCAHFVYTFSLYFLIYYLYILKKEYMSRVLLSWNNDVMKSCDVFFFSLKIQSINTYHSKSNECALKNIFFKKQLLSKPTFHTLYFFFHIFLPYIIPRRRNIKLNISWIMHTSMS